MCSVILQGVKGWEVVRTGAQAEQVHVLPVESRVPVEL